MIVTTVIAVCDQPGCLARHGLRPESTQHFRDLGEVGWTNVATSETVKTYCPRHS